MSINNKYVCEKCCGNLEEDIITGELTCDTCYRVIDVDGIIHDQPEYQYEDLSHELIEMFNHYNHMSFKNIGKNEDMVHFWKGKAEGIRDVIELLDSKF